MTAEGSDGAPDDDLEGVAALPPAWNGTAALAASGAVERLAASGADGPLLEQLADGGLGAVARPPLRARSYGLRVLSGLAADVRAHHVQLVPGPHLLQRG